MPKPSKIYFASDFHLGTPDHASSLIREKKLVRWLGQIMPETRELYLLGDIFDFWYEYRHAIPKGYTRLLGKIAEFTDAGIPVHIFTGNHDLWMRDYLVMEVGITAIHREPVVKEIDGKVFYLGHGDGLGPGDHGFKLMKKIFVSPLSQWLFSRIHPNTGIAIANYFSRSSRAQTGSDDANFYGEDKEWLIIHSKEVLRKMHIDYFIFGHRHYPLSIPVGPNSTYINLGDWINYFTYAVWDGQNLELRKFED